jgi:HJR/Mrr/RecB family endonuclease
MLNEHSSGPDLARAKVVRALRRIRRRPLDTLPLIRRRCPYCRADLRVLERVERPFSEDEDIDVETLGALELCPGCRYWRWHFVDSQFMARGGEFVHNYVSYVSKEREFAEVLPDGCASELAQWIRRKQQLWHLMSPRRLERLVADVFRANHADAEVSHVGRPADGGVDVVMVEASGNTWLIQVKRRQRPGSTEGVSTIRNLLGTMILNGARHGVVVSTADHFSTHALAAVGRARECGMIVRLVNRVMLDRLIEPLMPYDPWVPLLVDHFPDYVRWIAWQLGPREQLDLFPTYRESCSAVTDQRLLFLPEKALGTLVRRA